MDPDAVLDAIEAYQHAVACTYAIPVQVGPFTTYDRAWGWTFAAGLRPDRGEIDVASVRALAERQRDLSDPLELQWVHERAPALAAVGQAAGLAVARMPLLAHDPGHERARDPARGDHDTGAPDGSRVRLVDCDDPRFADSRAAVAAGFDGTDRLLGEPVLETMREYVRRGLIRAAGAWGPDGSVIGGGTQVRCGPTSEVTGLAVLPSWRRRGVGAAITRALVEDARALGASTVFLSAGSADVARVYRRIGFRTVGTLCTATEQ